MLLSAVRERALAEGFSLNVGDTRYPCVCRRTKPPEMDTLHVHSEKVREMGTHRDCNL